MDKPGKMQVVGQNFALGHLRHLRPIHSQDVGGIVRLDALKNDKTPALEAEGDIAVEGASRGALNPQRHRFFWLEFAHLNKLFTERHGSRPRQTFSCR